MNLDPRYLVQLATLVELGTFQAAADALGVTQPALTRTIQMLEQQVGVALFDRSARRAKPTNLGLELAGIGQAIKSAGSQALDLVQKHGAGRAGRLRVGAPPAIAGALLGAAFGHFFKDSPQTLATLVVGIVEDLRGRIRQGEIDLIIGPVGLADHASDLVSHVLFDDEIAFVCRRGHPILQRKSVAGRDLNGTSWVMHPDRSMLGVQTSGALEELGVEGIRIVLETESIEAALEVVQRTDLITSIPRKAASFQLAHRSIDFIPVSSSRLRRPVGAIVRKADMHSPLASRFLSALKVVVASEVKSFAENRP